MAKRKPYKWIATTGVKKPRHKGALHRALGYAPGEKIPRSVLEREVHKGGHVGHMALFALNMQGLRHHHGPLSKASLSKRRRRMRHAHHHHTR